MRKKYSKIIEDAILEQQNKALPAILMEIRHYLVTQMATLRGKQLRLEEIMPVLITNYQFALENKQVQGEIRKKSLDTIVRTINLNEQINPIIDFLDSASDYSIQLNPDSKAISPLSARQCVQDFLKTESLREELLKNRIQFETGKDFTFNLSPLFINALLDNLMSLALRQLNKADKGRINIWISEDEDYNIVNFQGAGFVLTAREQELIFNRFLLKSQDKTLPCIGFCKLALLHAGGDLICETSGDCTDFKILFHKEQE